MKKDIEWLKEEVEKQDIVMDKGYIYTSDLLYLIDNLDKTEVLSNDWINEHKVARINNLRKMTMSDVVSVDELRDLLVPKQELQVSLYEEAINIVLDDLKEYIKEQQSLSQNAGLAHTSAGNDTHYRQYGYVLESINEYEPSDELQNLLVPKQKLPVIPKHILEFIIKAFDVETTSNTIETLSGMTTDRFLEVIKDSKLVPKQELPVIPKYVADWIKEEQGTMSNWKLPSRFISDSKYKKDQRRYKWSQVEGNMDKFMSALINSYEVEDEPLYYALVKGHELVDIDGTYWIYDKNNDDMFISGLHPLDDNFLKAMSKDAWNKLGINDSNADFIKVEEVAK